MPRKQSDATALRACKAELAIISRKVSTTAENASYYRLKSERLEKELAEWKARFDKLLERTPKVQS